MAITSEKELVKATVDYLCWSALDSQALSSIVDKKGIKYKPDEKYRYCGEEILEFIRKTYLNKNKSMVKGFVILNTKNFDMENEVPVAVPLDAPDTWRLDDEGPGCAKWIKLCSGLKIKNIPKKLESTNIQISMQEIVTMVGEELKAEFPAKCMKILKNFKEKFWFCEPEDVFDPDPDDL
jgi:hypothetical protein